MNASHIKVLAINGSSRNDDGLAVLLRCVLNQLEREGIQTELIELREATVHACLSCQECGVMQNRHCVQASDMGNDFIEKMAQADGIVFGGPVQEADLSPQMQALMERACSVAQANREMFRHKVGAAVVPVHDAEAIHSFDLLNHFFLINGMVVPGTSFWNAGIAQRQNAARLAQEDCETMKSLGRNMAWLLENLKGPFGFPDLVEIVSQ